MTQTTDGPAQVTSGNAKPKLSILLASWFGCGFLPKAPGTAGALGGVVLAWVIVWISTLLLSPLDGYGKLAPLVPSLAMTLVVAIVGVIAAGRSAEFGKLKDPQWVVIDEVSGQQLTYFLGLTPFLTSRQEAMNPDFVGYGWGYLIHMLNWKCLLLGFVLFRVFDIWKPVPVRQLEKLPGGWGIMADDWMASVYAAILLQVALHFRVI